jgi:hypothetical protein
VSIKALPVEVLRKIFLEAHRLNALEIWPTPPYCTPIHRWSSYLLLCKYWQPILEELLYLKVNVNARTNLDSFKEALDRNPGLAQAVRSFSFEDFIPSVNAKVFFTLPLHRLQELHLSKIQIGEVSAGWKAMATSVKSLSLTSVWFTHDKAVDDFIDCFESLREISLNGIPNPSHPLWIIQKVGAKLETCSIKHVFALDISAYLKALPVVQDLSLQISTTSAWRSLDPKHLPSSIKRLSLQTWHLDFAYAFLSELVMNAQHFLPNLKHLPEVVWRPERGANYHLINRQPFQVLRLVALDILRSRNIRWTMQDADFTIFSGSTSD